VGSAPSHTICNGIDAKQQPSIILPISSPAGGLKIFTSTNRMQSAATDPPTTTITTYCYYSMDAVDVKEKPLS